MKRLLNIQNFHMQFQEVYYPHIRNSATWWGKVIIITDSFRIYIQSHQMILHIIPNQLTSYGIQNIHNS